MECFAPTDGSPPLMGFALSQPPASSLQPQIPVLVNLFQDKTFLSQPEQNDILYEADLEHGKIIIEDFIFAHFPDERV